jgi:hypothetical protein
MVKNKTSIDERYLLRSNEVEKFIKIFRCKKDQREFLRRLGKRFPTSSFVVQIESKELFSFMETAAIKDCEFESNKRWLEKIVEWRHL